MQHCMFWPHEMAVCSSSYCLSVLLTLYPLGYKMLLVFCKKIGQFIIWNLKGERSKVAQQRGMRYFPIALFASVMGYSGVTIAVRHAESLYGWNHAMSGLLLLFTSLLFIVNASVFIWRLIRHRRDVMHDFNHPVKMNFFAAISISLLLLAAAYFEISRPASCILWALGAFIQIGLTFMMLTKLLWESSFQLTHYNPAWFIPIVGNIVVPLGGTFHASPDINWFFFSAGTLFSIIYMTIFFKRVFFHPPLPQKLWPTLFILMAPPAIGFVSYTNLAGKVDVFAYMLYGTAFFIGLWLIFQIKRLFSTPFFVSWWAFLFPSAAMTIATVKMYTETGNIAYAWLFNAQVIGLIVLAIYLLWQTVRLAIKRTLCVKDS